MTSYLENSAPDKWLESCYEAEGPLYWAVLSLLLHPPSRWNRSRISHLRRLIVTAQARHTQPAGPAGPRLSDVSVKDYAVYKSYLVFFGLVDGIYTNYFKVRTVNVLNVLIFYLLQISFWVTHLTQNIYINIKGKPAKVK